MGITAEARASLHLSATTSLEPAAAFEIVRAAAGAVKGGGASLLTTGIVNIGANVTIVRSTDDTLTMALSSGKQLVELCTFRARTSHRDGRTQLTVGGLDTYKTQQEKALGFIPAGPKTIPGMAPYKNFLEGVRQRLSAADPAATIKVGQAQ